MNIMITCLLHIRKDFRQRATNSGYREKTLKLNCAKHKFGLKLWSTNRNYLVEAKKLYDKKIFDYIELYVIPGSCDGYLKLWKDLEIPYVLHAPHFRDGVNLAKKERENDNKKLIGEAQRFADKLGADKIIVHPGIDGDINETARQLKNICDNRILVENKPYHAIGSDLICNGTTPEEIKLVMNEAKVGFCLDIGHAICSAKAHGEEYLSYLREFIALKPAIYHLTDGDVNQFRDEHRHIGQGNYDMGAILKMIPAEAMITIETNKDSNDNLSDFKKDIEVLKVLWNKLN